MAKDVACCWSGRVMAEPLGPRVATGADVPTLARGRLVSGGKPERSCDGRVDSRDMKGVAASPRAAVDKLVVAGGLAAVVVCQVGWGTAVGSGPGSGEGGRLVGCLGPGWTFSVDGTISTPSVTMALTGTCSTAVLASVGGLLGLDMPWACMSSGISVLVVTFVVIAGVTKASWDSEDVGSLEVTAAEASGLEAGLAGDSRPGKACKGVVLTGTEPGPGTVTALVISGKRGTGGDWEGTVMLGLPAKVTGTLVVSMALNPMPGIGTCCERGRDEVPGVWGVVSWLAATPLLAGVCVGCSGRLDVVTPSGCCRVAWEGPGGSIGPSVAAMDGFRAVVSGKAGVSAGL